ncbi:MAG: glycosyltransferase [Oculatellaceae cyanobacterium Prado106]|jgi:glycosyltransferase involved in cell wall biosynthesis|nr:glycosyltransferase [Oculatellaceae cyanobacterium Prado106]
MKPVISVITPVFNGEQFIQSCIQVVLDQHCPAVEHLIIDGGSNDRTLPIIQQYAAQYPHIRWISQPDRGQSDAMNKGIALAQGDIIALLNVDDYYEPNVLNQVLQQFQTLSEPALLVGNCQIWNEHGQRIGLNRPEHLKLTDLLLGQNIHPFPLNPSAYFYHRSLHQTIGLYDVNDHYSMDVDFLFRAVQAAHVRYVDQVWGNYRLMPGTKTFTDCHQGLNATRLEQLMNKYRRQLPWGVRSRFEVKYFFVKTGERIQYFAQHQDEIWPKLRARVQQWISKMAISNDL